MSYCLESENMLPNLAKGLLRWDYIKYLEMKEVGGGLFQWSQCNQRVLSRILCISWAQEVFEFNHHDLPWSKGQIWTIDSPGREGILSPVYLISLPSQKVKMKVIQSSPTLQLHGLCSLWKSPGQNTSVTSLSLLQGIFPTQGSNSGLAHCKQILYQLSTRVTQEYWSG